MILRLICAACLAMMLVPAAAFATGANGGSAPDSLQAQTDSSQTGEDGSSSLATTIPVVSEEGNLEVQAEEPAALAGGISPQADDFPPAGGTDYSAKAKVEDFTMVSKYNGAIDVDKGDDPEVGYTNGWGGFLTSGTGDGADKGKVEFRVSMALSDGAMLHENDYFTVPVQMGALRITPSDWVNLVDDNNVTIGQWRLVQEGDPFGATIQVKFNDKVNGMSSITPVTMTTTDDALGYSAYAGADYLFNATVGGEGNANAVTHVMRANYFKEPPVYTDWKAFESGSNNTVNWALVTGHPIEGALWDTNGTTPVADSDYIVIDPLVGATSASMQTIYIAFRTPCGLGASGLSTIPVMNWTVITDDYTEVPQSGDTVDDFADSLLPRQYGFYTDDTGLISYVANYGNPKTNGYNLDAIYGDFATAYADDLIARHHFLPSDRDALIAQAKLAFGNANTVNGNAFDFETHINAVYPTTLNDVPLTNTATQTVNGETHDTYAEGLISGMYGKVSANPYEIIAFKTDADTGEMIPDATLKIQQSLDSGATWSDYTAAPTQVTTENGIATFGPVGVNCMYRVVETAAASGYDITTSPGYDAAAGGVVSEGFNVPENETEGHKIVLQNTKKNEPVVSVDKKLDTAHSDLKMGGTAVYTITLKNTGAVDAIDYEFSDAFEGLDYISSSASGGQTVTYTSTGTGTGTFKVNKVRSGSTVTVTARYKITSNPFRNYAWDPSGLTPNKIRVTSATDMTPATDTLQVNQKVYYLVTATNNSTEPISSQEFVDNAGSGLKIVDAQIKDGAGTVSAVSTDGKSVTWQTGDVAVGATASMLVTAVVTADGNGTATNWNTTELFPHVTRLKTLDYDASDLKIGGTAVFKIELSNDGKADAEDYVLTDDFEGLTFTSADCDGANITATDTSTPGTVNWTIDSIPVDKTVTITASFTIDEANFSNFVSHEGEAKFKKTLDKVEMPDGTLRTDGRIFVGDTVYYTVSAENATDVDVASETINDLAIDGLMLDTATIDNGDADSSVTIAADGYSASWTTGVIGAGETTKVEFKAHAIVATKGTVANFIEDGGDVTLVPIVEPSKAINLEESTLEMGGTAVYDLTFTNTGTLEATDYVYNDSFEGLEFISNTGDAVWTPDSGGTPGKGTFTIPSIPVGATVTVQASYKIVDNPFMNYAWDPGTLKPSKIRVKSPTDLTPAEPGTVRTGDTIYYLLTEANETANKLPSQSVTDNALNGFKITAASVISGSGTPPIVATDGMSLTWKTGDVDPGAEASLLITAVAQKQTEGNSTNEVKDGGGTTEFFPNVTPLKSLNFEASTLEMGGMAVYDFTLTNTGEAPAEDYVFNDAFNGLEYVSNTGDATWASTGTGKGTFTLPEIGVDETVTFSATFKIIDNPFRNFAWDPGDLIPDKIRVTSATDMTPAPAGKVKPGDIVYYLITAKNDSTVDIVSETKTDTARNGFIILDAEVAAGSGTVGDVSADGKTVTWETGDVAPGDTASMLVTAKATKQTNGHSTNEITGGDFTELTPDVVSDKNLDSANSDINVGGLVTYDIIVTNQGQADAVDETAPVVRDTFDGLEFISATIDGATIVSTDTSTAGQVVFTLDSLAIGQSAVITTTSRITAESHTNDVMTVLDVPDHAIKKIRVTSATDMTPMDGTVYAGDTIYYLITEENLGATVYDTIPVTDIPGVGLTLTDIQTISGTAFLNADGTATWNTGVIQPGETVSALVTATVGEDAVGTVTNKAKDPDGASLRTDPVGVIVKTGRLAKTGDTTMWLLFAGCLLAGAALAWYTHCRKPKLGAHSLRK